MWKFLRPYLALTALVLAAIYPLANAAFTCSDDGAFHLFRAVALEALLRAGEWLPRWSPQMAQGYGYPFFNFYAPLSSYLVVALKYLLGVSFPVALKLAFGVGVWGAAVATFGLARAHWGERAGVVAGAAYALTPYLAYDVFYRANFAEALAFVWLPVVLWGLKAKARQYTDHTETMDDTDQKHLKSVSSVYRFFVHEFTNHLVAIGGYAALILTHNIFALIASPLFAGYVVWQAVERRSWRTLLMGGLALALGIGLTTFFWWPALAERALVHSERLLVRPIFTWDTNFLAPSELLAWPRPEDPLLLNPSPTRTVGLITVLLGLPALMEALWAWLKRRPTPAGGLVLGAALALAGYGGMTLEISTPVWQLIKPLELVQFPWRLLGPAALCAALLAGASVPVLEKWAGPRRGAWCASAGLVVIFAANLPAWYPRYCAVYGEVGVAEMVQFEQASYTIGTTAKGEYLPLTTGGPPAEDALAQALMRGEEPIRLQASTPNTTINLQSTVYNPLGATFQILTPEGGWMIYRQFFYPGWEVWLDGEPHHLRLTPEGLIEFYVPPGLHTVRIFFGLTLTRTLALGVSGMTLLVVLGLSARKLLLKTEPRSRQAREGWVKGFLRVLRAFVVKAFSAPELPSRWEVGIALCLALLRVFALDQFPNPLRHTAWVGDTVTTAQHALRTDFAGGLRLYGYDLSATTLPADAALDAAWYVSLSAPTDRRYWPGFALEDATRQNWLDPNYIPPRWHREPYHTPDWPLDRYAQWARHLQAQPGTPPGNYELWGWVFDLDSLQMQSVLAADGNALAPRFRLGTLTLTRPTRPFQLTPPRPLFAAFDGIALLGYDLNRETLNVGETLDLTLFWRSDQPVEDRALRLSLVNAAGAAALTTVLSPTTNYSSALWQPGDEWRGQHRLRLPAALPDGIYTLTVAVPPVTAFITLAPLTITAPTRTFTAPAFAAPHGAEFAAVGRLAGYTLRQTTETLQLDLVWQATASPLTSYSVFVHLADDNGRVWAQRDSAPANWARPTTGWVPDEYVFDSRGLTLPPDLPAGTYTVWVGLYDPATQARVPATGPGADGNGRVAVTTLTTP